MAMETIPRNMSTIVFVNLGLGVDIPLKTETLRIIVVTD
jgi:hypothetical protein